MSSIQDEYIIGIQQRFADLLALGHLCDVEGSFGISHAMERFLHIGDVVRLKN
jgi:hypothetical protein